MQLRAICTSAGNGPKTLQISKTLHVDLRKYGKCRVKMEYC